MKKEKILEIILPLCLGFVGVVILDLIERLLRKRLLKKMRKAGMHPFHEQFVNVIPLLRLLGIEDSNSNASFGSKAK